MAMLAAQEKGLFYPTPLSEVDACFAHIQRFPPKRGVIFDPCMGDGVAVNRFRQLLGDWIVAGIEPDDQRYLQAKQLCASSKQMDDVIHGSLQDFNLYNYCDILFLNPPYDHDQVQHERMEWQFLRWTAHTLRPGGLLFYVIPERLIVDSWGETTRQTLKEAGIMGSWKAFRFSESEYDAFNQIVIIGRKKEEDGYCYLGEIGSRAIADTRLGDLPVMENSDYYHRTFYLNETPQGIRRLYIQAKSKIELRPHLLEAGQWSALKRILPHPDNAKHGTFTPLFPLKYTMAVLVVCSGMLNNTIIDGQLIRGGFRIGEGVVDRQAHHGGGEQWKIRTVPVTTFQILNLETKTLTTIDEQENPDEYQQFLGDNAQAIVDAATKQYPALYNPDKDFVDFNKIISPPRFLERAEDQGIMSQQMHRMSALVKGFSHRKTQVLIGTPGTGKTLMSIGVAHQLKLNRGEHGKNHKTIVMCPASPPDLADKWIAEIEAVLKNWPIHTAIVNNTVELREAMDRPGWGWLVIRETKTKQNNPWIQIKMPVRGKPRQRIPICPRCHRYLTDAEQTIYQKNLDEQAMNGHSASKRVMMSCQDQKNKDDKVIAVGCGEAWWTRIVPEGTERRKFPVASALKEWYPQCYDFVEDEAHENKGVTGRGGAAYDIALGARTHLQLTGTYFNGKAGGIFYMMYRGSPEIRDIFNIDKPGDFTDRYGCVEVSQWDKPCYDQYHTVTGYITESGETREAPGLKPALVRYTLPMMTILSKSDLDVDMVPYSEHTMFVETTDAHWKEYERFKEEVSENIRAQYIAAMQGTEGAMRKAMSYQSWGAFALHSCLDNPTLPLIHEAGTYIPPKVKPGFIYPKEEALMRLILQNKAEERGVLIYLHQMASRDVSPRLMDIALRFGLHTTVMYSNERERVKFIDDKMLRGYHAAFTNHQLVKVGVDIISTPTVAWYSLYRSLNFLDVPQANQRPHRPHQTQPVKVVYMGVQNTVQSRDARYVAEKAKVMQSYQGDAPNGLALLETDNTFQDKLARELSDLAGDKWYESDLDWTELPILPEITYGLPSNGHTPKSLTSVTFAPVEKIASDGTIVGSQIGFF